MEKFIEEHTTFPKKFIKDFYFITGKTYSETDISINFDLVAKWLDTEKGHLKEVLINNFEEEYDYNEIKMTKKDGAKSNNYKKINISSACFTAFRILNAR